MMEGMDDTVQAYIDGIGPEQRPLFDRLHRLILGAYPTVDIVLSYRMPTYKVDGRSLHVAAWSHGVSLYGWNGERDGGFVERHPEMTSGKGTLRLRSAEAEMISDDELRSVIEGALSDG